jgi:hypothetical protein
MIKVGAWTKQKKNSYMVIAKSKVEFIVKNNPILWRALLDKIICLLNLGFDRENISFALVLLLLDSWNWALISETYILP